MLPAVACRACWGAARVKRGCHALTRFCITDAQSVENTDCARRKGYDAGKKVSGIKRHIRVDTHRLPHVLAVRTADVTGCQGALAASGRCPDALLAVRSVLVDGGHTGQPFADAIRAAPGASVQVAKRNELHSFAVIPQRWIVERAFAWLG